MTTRRDTQARIVSVEAVTPLMRRLVVAAEGLATAFATPPGVHGPYLKLVLGAETDRRVVRTYSIRHLDPARDELHLDFLLHASDGPGSAFARAARPGDPIRLAGPGHLPPAPAAHAVVAGDHCALPAIAHLLAHLPSNARGTALIEVPHESEIQEMAHGRGIDLMWLVRPPSEPSRLAEAVAALQRPSGDETLVWGGAQAATARVVRHHALGRWQIAKPQCQVLNYWKAGQAEGGFSYVA